MLLTILSTASDALIAVNGSTPTAPRSRPIVAFSIGTRRLDPRSSDDDDDEPTSTAAAASPDDDVNEVDRLVGNELPRRKLAPASVATPPALANGLPLVRFQQQQRQRLAVSAGAHNGPAEHSDDDDALDAATIGRWLKDDNLAEDAV